MTSGLKERHPSLSLLGAALPGYFASAFSGLTRKRRRMTTK
jgi:hypothetical protein